MFISDHRLAIERTVTCFSEIPKSSDYGLILNIEYRYYYQYQYSILSIIRTEIDQKFTKVFRKIHENRIQKKTERHVGEHVNM